MDESVVPIATGIYFVFQGIGHYFLANVRVTESSPAEIQTQRASPVGLVRSHHRLTAIGATSGFVITGVLLISFGTLWFPMALGTAILAIASIWAAPLEGERVIRFGFTGPFYLIAYMALEYF